MCTDIRRIAFSFWEAWRTLSMAMTTSSKSDLLLMQFSHALKFTSEFIRLCFCRMTNTNDFEVNVQSTQLEFQICSMGFVHENRAALLCHWRWVSTVISNILTRMDAHDRFKRLIYEWLTFIGRCGGHEILRDGFSANSFTFFINSLAFITPLAYFLTVFSSNVTLALGAAGMIGSSLKVRLHYIPSRINKTTSPWTFRIFRYSQRACSLC